MRRQQTRDAKERRVLTLHALAAPPRMPLMAIIL
jgi:hypothetical protein